MTLIDTKATLQEVKYGRNVCVWTNSVVLDSILEDDVHVGCLTEIKGARIGQGTRIGSGVFICDGVDIGKYCFIGPKVCFTNDKYPEVSEEHYRNFVPEKTKVGDYAVIGANSTILPGLFIGEGVVIGAGSVVTKDVPAYELWRGNPARYVRKT